jgi:hypothetical protein
MRKTSSSPWRWLTRTGAAVLVTAILAVSAQAGTFTVVDLPATGTDAAIGISDTKEYTHTFDFGSTTVATVNGVEFERGTSGSITAAFTGTSKQGYGWTLTDTRASVSVAIHEGNDPTGQCDGASMELLRDMMYHSGSTTIGAGAVLTLSDLKPGTAYSTRYYYRSWSGATADRTITCQGDGGKNGDFSDVLDIEIDAGGSHYLEYAFIADDTDVTIRFLTNDNNNGVHLYAVTNEVASAPGSAILPNPSNGAADILRDVNLSWQADADATAHNVYFGTSYDDVSAGAASVLVSEGQTQSTFDPGRLEFGRTYYWRVDEVGASVVGGNVWSFTVEPLSYAIGDVVATASSSADNMGPQKTVDGSGLNAQDQHGTSGETMWLNNKNDPSPWIQYEFAKPYRLDKMLVWNSNQPIEMMIGFGAKAVTVECSLDGQTWTTVGDFEFARATGLATYTANTTIDFAGAAAKYVKLAISSNWGGVVQQFGLSEVRFFQIPTVAREPSPASGKTGLTPWVNLSWKPGREAASHQVFLGTDAADLALADTVTEPACELDNLALGQTYYWKVVEVNEAETPSTWESDVWSFTVDRSIAVEDFEIYDDEDNRIYQTWLDGYDVDGNGSIVGYGESPFAERTVLFGGKQSMPFAYSNSGSATYSETERTFDSAQDWTRYGVKSLVVHFAGSGANTGSGKLYVKINNTKVVYTGASSDLTIGVWTPWTIDLASTGANLSKVTKLVLGVEGSGAAGTLFFDEIRLFPSVATTVTPADPGATGLVAYYKFEGDAKDSAGSHHGKVVGATFAAGKVGQALKMTNNQEYVEVAYSADLAMNSFTAAVWVNVSDVDDLRAILGTRFTSDNTFDMKVEAGRIHGDIGNGSAWLNTSVDITAAQGGVIGVGEWHHIAYVIDDAADVAKVYLDGALGATVTFSGTPLFMKADQVLRIGNCSGTEYMHGMIDEVRLYNRALSEAEVAGLAGRTGPVFIAP